MYTTAKLAAILFLMETREGAGFYVLAVVRREVSAWEGQRTADFLAMFVFLSTILKAFTN